MRTYKVLTVRQPWAHLIIDGTKTVENRTWKTDYRGPIAIHAAASVCRETIEQFELDPDELHFGAVIGIVELADIVTQHRSPFFTGPFGWVLKKPRAMRPVPMRGQLKLFTASLNLRHR